ncbi:hypothetical protein SAMN04487981_114175 [Streptomyces sp. cf386]|uniref:hypothetical protein n=1 Tax=Streptomyces sp. cf386 TaxID=1761904 RepID=UPI00088CB29E|nr:hypothetical protein [Streptomyces sp. cf386]SDO90927.1 hypothetical protein SAMN04487981_114175 [Streptomyces sp. cf386]
MRRTARLVTGTVLAVGAVGLVGPPAYGDGGGLEVSPSAVVPGGEVTVSTAACRDGGAAGDASAVGAGELTLAPGTDGEDASGVFRVPPSAQPGTYEIVATCGGGGRRVSGDLVVTLTAPHEQVHPRGSVKTGVGGALGDGDPVQTVAGVGALAVAAAGGTWLLHRRARGDGI